MTGAYALVFFLFSINAGLGAQAADQRSVFPAVTRLDQRDVVFKQYLDDVAAGRRSVYSNYEKKPDSEIAKGLVIYSYTPDKNDNLMLIASRCNIPYDAIVTLNRWMSMPSLSHSSGPVLLPSIPGIFVSEEPASDLERLVFFGRNENNGVLINLTLPSGVKEQFRFIPGDSFTPNERYFFLNPGLFRFPLYSYKLTSAFGIRVSPINGKRSMHGGIDLAAPAGTDVFASRAGTVTEAGYSAVYGKYVIITHPEGWTSLYGHLSAVETAVNAKVRAGSLIGKVGSTGLSTGPHLHFELRQNGQPKDPKSFLSQSRPLAGGF